MDYLPCSHQSSSSLLLTGEASTVGHHPLPSSSQQSTMAGGDYASGGRGQSQAQWVQQLQARPAQAQPPAGTSTPVDAGLYVNELMQEVRALQLMGVQNPAALPLTHQLLCRELSQVTSATVANTQPYRPPALRQQPQQHDQSAMYGAGGDRSLVPSAGLGARPRPRPHTIESRLPIPTVDGINFIGRIVGPRGITVKQMEQMYGCKILVRGQGSVKDVNRERRLIGCAGWEHLTEPLHVHVSVTDRSSHEAQMRLDATVKELRKLLTAAGNDQLKHVQLMELAIINGTYRPLPHAQLNRAGTNNKQPTNQQC